MFLFTDATGQALLIQQTPDTTDAYAFDVLDVTNPGVLANKPHWQEQMKVCVCVCVKGGGSCVHACVQA